MPESYRIETGARDLSMTRGEAAHPLSQSAEGFAQATVDLTRNAAYLRSLRITSRSNAAGDQTLTVTGSLIDFARPRWDARAQGMLDMTLLESTTGYPNSPEGLGRLDLQGKGYDGQFRIDGNIHVDNGSYISDGVYARGVGLDARVHADPERLMISSVVARLKQGGQIEGLGCVGSLAGDGSQCSRSRSRERGADQEAALRPEAAHLRQNRLRNPSAPTPISSRFRSTVASWRSSKASLSIR